MNKSYLYYPLLRNTADISRNSSHQLVLLTMSRGKVALSVIVGVSFVLGFLAGYKAKEYRIRWLRRRRDFLQEKLIETQREIDSHQNNYRQRDFQ
jgi:hypothetical protein